MAESHADTSPTDLARYGQNYLIEMDGIELYRALAAAEKDEKRAEIFRKIVRAEERHAQRWIRLIQAGGGVLPAYRRSLRVRMLGWLARRFGTDRVVPIVSALEARDEPGYLNQSEAEGLPAEERAHSRVLREMAKARILRAISSGARRGIWRRAAAVCAPRCSVSMMDSSLISV